MAAIWERGMMQNQLGMLLRVTNRRGNRKFWREYLPRLKYHNPSIPMIVNRHDQMQNPPLMTIYLRNSGSATPEPLSQTPSSRTNISKAQPPASDERTIQIDMKDKRSAQILEFFMAETGAVPLQPTPEEIAEMRQLETMQKQGTADRERVGRIRAEKKREEEMLKRAKAAGGLGDEEQA